MRSTDNADRSRFKEGLSAVITADQILRQPDRQNLQFPDQQLFDPRTDRRRPLPVSMAGGAVFQMDQTTPENQILLWNFRECGEEPDLDRHLGLRARGDHQKTTQPQTRPLPNITDFESDSF